MTFAPFLFAREVTARAHAGVVALLIGVCFLFVYGAGIEPRTRAWRVLFPASAWAALAAGAMTLAYK